MTVPPHMAEKNRENGWNAAIKYAQGMNQRLVDVLTEVAKEKIQYFEKKKKTSI